MGVTLKQSFKDRVYAEIKADIVQGRLRPGMRILTRDIGRPLGLSRTPIRDALLQLSQEGLVVVSPRRGIFVANRTLDEIEEIRWLLGLLESAAAARAIRRMGDAEIRELAEVTRQLVDACRQRKILKFAELNAQAHDVFLAACGSPRLRALCAKLRDQLHQYPLRMFALPGWMEKSVAEHQTILRAFARRQRAQIESIIRRHWRFKQPRAAILEALAKADTGLQADIVVGAGRAPGSRVQRSRKGSRQLARPNVLRTATRRE
jgi:DNA-binding GntR family transcriptional regulator